MLLLITATWTSTSPGPPPSTFGPLSTTLTNKPAGPVLTRKRFEEEFWPVFEAARKAEEKAQKFKKEVDRLRAGAVVREAQDAANALAVQAQLAEQRQQDSYHLLQLRHALDGFNNAQSARAAMQAAHVIALSALAARANFDDDDEAIALLMMH